MRPEKTLDDYQIESRDFLLSHNFRCLFDEPGVGKTGPAIMAGWAVLDKGKDGSPPVLITVPAYLIDNWVKEIHAFVPSAVVVRADGAGYKARSEAFAADADFVLTSYNNWSAKKDGGYTYPELVTRKWSAYIFDEGHRLRGYRAAWTRHVYRTRLAKSPNMVTPIWILTGTPFVRDGGDFYTYFHLYDKKQHRGYQKFVEKRCVIRETPWGRQVGNISKAYADDFRRELAEFSLRRTVSEIPQLAALEYVETSYTVSLAPSVLAMIKKAKKEYVLEHEDLAHPEFLNGSGALYVAQRKIATIPPTKANPKLAWLKDFLTDKRGKTVVYTWFKDSARMVADSLGDQAVLITGDVPANKRSDRISTWRSSDGPQVLVATIPSLSTGISLTESRDVVFLEHSELPSDQEQCIKRLCRRGQTHVVNVHHVDALGSVDMAIKAVLEGRIDGIQDALKKWVATEDPEEDWFN